MKIKPTDQAVEWFKDELDLPENDKVLQFYVRYGGEFQLKQGFSPAFRVEPRQDVEIGYEENYNDLILVVSEDDLWYFEDSDVLVEKVDHDDEIAYSKVN
ncbi:HesB/YadR/YfhF family protein [Staphylococcus borealis]|uniref:HesB/YadR/YfhF family protein n=1 Tax=Staphylococcus borealis TaxID=2742203 RepID=UPI00259FE394|nr:HesB/YadR/YfhF family protein [Staphylococcus borealis]MDM7863191.1 HesB/YadR/YfhF family protein [Staphylococcus borealis]